MEGICAIANTYYSAEHGCFMRHPHSTEWVNLTESTDMSWQQKVMDIFGLYTDKTPGMLIWRLMYATKL